MAHGIAPPLAAALDALDQPGLHARPGRQRTAGVQCPSRAVLGRGFRFRASAVRARRLSRVGDDPRLPVAGDGSTLAFLLRLVRSEEHTSELQSLMRISYAVFCLKKKRKKKIIIKRMNSQEQNK